MSKFDRFAFSANPEFDEARTRVAFSKAVPENAGHLLL